jgi:hypothetical protein
MASNFPSSLDSFTNPSSSDAMDSVSVPHATQHSDLNDAVEALQAKVGADSSAVTSSHDYKIAQLEGRDTAGLVHISRTLIGTAVSSVTVTGAFSSTYANYRIAISEGSSTVANAGLLMQVAGAGAGAYYSTVLYYTMGLGTAGTAVQNGTSYIDVGGVRGTIMDVMNAGETTNQIFVTSLSADPQYFRACAGRINYTSIPASFSLLPNGGTLTGGYIDVYGYAKA